MTTVAFRNGVMASDRESNLHGAEVDKVFCGEGGILYGIAGVLSKCRKVVDWLISQNTAFPSDPPDVGSDEDWNVLVAYPDGSLFLYDWHLYPLQMKAPFLAIGSGSGYAMGAMAAGASAKKAVEIASQFDSYTGSVVDTFKL